MFDDHPPPENKINGSFALLLCQPINFEPGRHMYKTN